jgi:hypothetical protein
MDVYTEPAAHGKPEQGAPSPSEYLDFLVPIAAHDVLARARELLDISDAEPPHNRECWGVEAAHGGSDSPRRASRSPSATCRRSSISLALRSRRQT